MRFTLLHFNLRLSGIIPNKTEEEKKKTKQKKLLSLVGVSVVQLSRVVCFVWFLVVGCLVVLAMSM